MRCELQELYDKAKYMDQSQLLEKFREVLTDYDELLSLKSETERASHEMSVQYAQMRDRLAGSEKENKLLKEENLKLTQQLNLRCRDLFGRSTEKSADIDCFPAAAEPLMDPVSEDTAEEVSAGEPVMPATRCLNCGSSSGRSSKGGRKMPDFSRLPVKTEFRLDIDTMDREYGEGNWRIFGWEKHQEYASVPSAKYLKVTYTPVLSVGLEHHMERVPYTDQLLPGSYASPSFVSQIMYDKFVLALPTYRLEQDLLRNGIPVSRQTMSNWIIRFSFDLFGPVYDRMADILRAGKYSQCDETILKVIHDGRNSGSISYMWIQTTGELYAGPAIIIFGYELTRGTDHLREFYLNKGFRGFLTSDAYVSYDVLEKEAGGEITSTGCFMHCRRRFVQAILVLGRKQTDEKIYSELPEVKARMLIDEIYEADTPLKDLSAEERQEKRNSTVRPKVDAFFEYIHSLDPEAPAYSERMKDAISYTCRQEDKLRRFLDDPNIPCDNGYAERSIRTLAIGRRNWLFCNTVTGAESMAIIYSLTETAKANDAHPYYYLKYLLEQMPKHMDETDRSFLDEMMPWSEKYRQYEKLQKDQDVRYFSDQEPPVAPKTPRKRKTA